MVVNPFVMESGGNIPTGSPDLAGGGNTLPDARFETAHQGHQPNH